MTLAELEQIIIDAKALGAAPTRLTLRRDTAVHLVEHYDLTPLARLAARYGLTVRLNERCVAGEILLSEANE